MGTRTMPRHARPLVVGRWAGRIAEQRLARLPVDAAAARADARRDPLHDPLAVTEHCVIGDQIRLPAACCDIAGCGAEYADLAALGEADNRARALVAGWRVDALSRLVCPDCQQRDALTLPRIPGPAPDTGGGRIGTAVSAGPRDGERPPVRARRLPVWARSRFAQAKNPPVQASATGSHGVVGPGRHRVTGWLDMLTTLASGNNGWSVPQPFTGLPMERNDAGPQAGAA